MKISIKLNQFSIDERGSLFYLWSGIISITCLYNLIIIPMVFFNEFYTKFYKLQILFNIISDILNVLDIILQLFKGVFYFK